MIDFDMVTREYFYNMIDIGEYYTFQCRRNIKELPQVVYIEKDNYNNFKLYYRLKEELVDSYLKNRKEF